LSATRRPGKPVIVATYALLCVIWGTTWSVIQIGLRGIPPFSGVAIRFALATVVLLGLSFARGIRLGAKPHEKMLWLVNGVLSFAVSYGVVYWAEQWVPSGLASVLFATYPLFVAMLAHFLLPRERIVLPELIGIVLGFFGVGVIFSSDFGALGGAQVAVASVVMLLSPLAAAIGSVAVKRWGGAIHPFSLSAVPMGISAGIMGAVALALERDRTFAWDPVSVGALLYLALAGSVVTFSLYYWLLSHMPAKRLALIAYTIPIIAVLIGALRGEPLLPRALAGSAMVVVGIALAVHRR
jgi:drug/metabolite transporter (DMT)-like permease